MSEIITDGETAATVTIGDYAEIVCHDGREFEGIIDAIEPTHLLLNGLGFPWEDIVAVHA